MTGKRPVETEEDIPLDDGVHTYISIRFPLYDSQNDIYGVCSIATDISERIRAEKILKDFNESLKQEVDQRTRELKFAKEQADSSKEKAEMANRAKSAFLASMSHELRTPMNAILGFSQLINRDVGIAPEHREHLAIIQRSGEHLLTLINEVLDMSKIEAGRITLNKRNFDLHFLLNDLKDMMKLRAGNKSLSLTVEISPDVPRYVGTDETKLRQVIVNLIGNAIKFTEEGGVTVRVGASCGAPPRLHFEIEDTGPGIAPEDTTVLFDPFVQTETGRQSGDGAGLGLAISQKFIQLMGGDIAVRSEVGKGTVFVFDIRVHPVDVGDIESSPVSRHVIGIEPGQVQKKILIVDDNPDNRKLLYQMHESLGFKLREAKNGQEAVEIWREWTPDLIWMDIRMPIMEACEMIKTMREKVKKEHKKAECIIIAQTAISFEEDREVILNAGCDDFLRKPYKQTDVLMLLEKHIGIRFMHENVSVENGKPLVNESRTEQITFKDLSTISDRILKRLKQAAMEADIDEIDRIINEIRQINKQTAVRLTELANEYEYGRIIKIIEEMDRSFGAESDD
jgi:signal transduction histidine kinase/DNA-binding response OmpR family regulator